MFFEKTASIQYFSGDLPDFNCGEEREKNTPPSSEAILSWRLFRGVNLVIDWITRKNMVPVRGIEPPTFALRMRCSTSWATPATHFINHSTTDEGAHFIGKSQKNARVEASNLFRKNRFLRRIHEARILAFPLKKAWISVKTRIESPSFKSLPHRCRRSGGFFRKEE